MLETILAASSRNGLCDSWLLAGLESDMEGMDNITVGSLAGVTFDRVADAFLQAFADYGMKLDRDSLSDMFRRRGARFDLSYAAFDGDRIVSFIINGIGVHNGRLTAYDTGTGTVKEYRGLGLTDRIFAGSLGFLRAAGVESYLLEVLKENVPAVKIYTRLGFETMRGFDCYNACNMDVLGRLAEARGGCVEIRPIEAGEVGGMAGFMDFCPSWQNSIGSIMRNKEAFLCVGAFKGGVPVGFGVSETAYGDITLLAVDRNHRRQGIGSALLKTLVENNRADRAKVLNVEENQGPAKSFLTASGFEFSCGQYEMARQL